MLGAGGRPADAGGPFGLEGAAIYWHFVDIVWIGLFATYYLLK